jgi:hypothetical protein
VATTVSSSCTGFAIGATVGLSEQQPRAVVFRFQAARPTAWMPTIAMSMPAAGIRRICRAKALQIIDDSDPAHATTVATFQLPSFSDAQLRMAELWLSYDQFFRAAVAMLPADD